MLKPIICLTEILFLLLFCAGCIQQREAMTVIDPNCYRQNQTYYHFMITGQSLSYGSWGMDSLSGSFSNQQPYLNFMLSTNPLNANPNGALGTVAPLIPLEEPFYQFSIKRFVETPTSGVANTFAAFDDHISPGYGVIGTAHGYGGQPYAQIKKNPIASSPPFLQRYKLGQQQVQQVYSELTTNPDFAGASYKPLGVVVIHGESDQLQGKSMHYEGYLNEFQQDYEYDMIEFLRLNNEPPISSFPMFITQMNTRGPSQMAIVQMDAVKNNKEIFMVGPTYQYSFFDKTHLNGAAEYRHLGENIGKVMYKVGVLKENWLPLMPKNIVYNNKLITIEFHIPAGSLTFDAPSHSIDSLTGTKHFYENYGFEYIDDSNSAYIVPGSVVIGPDKKSVNIYLSKKPTGSNPRVRYAAQTYAGISSGTSAGCRYQDVSSGITCYGGNLRDSDNTISPAIDGINKPLYNWCVSFDEPLFLDIHTEIILQGPYDPNTGLMKAPLVDQGLFPTIEPYSSQGYTYVNASEKGTTVVPSVLNATGKNKPVDWVVIELIDPFDKTRVIQAQTGILQSDGDIVDPSGLSDGVQFNSLITKDYHLQIRHRNHLSVSTMEPVRVNWNLGVVNFSTSQNTTYQKRIGNKKMLWAGDADKNKVIDENDRFFIQSHSGAFGYFNSDINIDGVVNAEDRALIWNNRKLFSIGF